MGGDFLGFGVLDQSLLVFLLLSSSSGPPVFYRARSGTPQDRSGAVSGRKGRIGLGGATSRISPLGPDGIRIRSKSAEGSAGIEDFPYRIFHPG